MPYIYLDANQCHCYLLHTIYHFIFKFVIASYYYIALPIKGACSRLREPAKERDSRPTVAQPHPSFVGLLCLFSHKEKENCFSLYRCASRETPLGIKISYVELLLLVSIISNGVIYQKSPKFSLLRFCQQNNKILTKQFFQKVLKNT